MRTIQEIFDVVIDRGLYGQTESRFMCWALDIALRSGVITKDEYCIATREIGDYLNGWFTFEAALRTVGLPRSFPDRLAIYKDWANRPSLSYGV